MRDIDGTAVRGSVRARNIRIHGRRTSVKLEPAYWNVLETASRREGVAVNDICSMVHDRAGGYGLTGSLRVFLLAYAWERQLQDALAAVPLGTLSERTA